MARDRIRMAVSMAQIISALAVVLSLVYAASELKRSRALTSTDVETVIYERILEMDRLVAENADLADIITRAREDPQGLSASERARYLAYEHIFYDSWEAAFAANEMGLMDADQFASWDEWFTADAARRPALSWTGNLRNYNQDFIDYVEQRVSWE